MSDEHTPGEWRAKPPAPGTSNWTIVTDDGASGLASVYHADDRRRLPVRANALLMAASPKMLSALRKALTYLGPHAEDGGWADDVYVDVRDAIAEATKGGDR